MDLELGTSFRKITTLEDMPNDKITNRRRDGNTIRLVDNAIQILFSGNVCVVLDHHERGRNRISNKDLFDKILKRLEFEHKYLFDKKLIKYDVQHLEIRLLDKPIENKLEPGIGITLNNI